MDQRSSVIKHVILRLHHSTQTLITATVKRVMHHYNYLDLRSSVIKHVIQCLQHSTQALITATVNRIMRHYNWLDQRSNVIKHVMLRLQHSTQTLIPARVNLATLHLQQTLIYVLHKLCAIKQLKIIIQEQILVLVKLHMF